MPSAHFGSYGAVQPSSAPNHGKRRQLRPLPHAGSRCACQTCDQLREANGNYRVSVNWARDYLPLFYLALPEDQKPRDWEQECREDRADWAKILEGWDDDIDN